MKTINAFLIIAFISFAISPSSSEKQTCEGHKPNVENGQAFSLDFCRTTNKGGYAACCFVKWKKGDLRQYNCYPVTNSEWGNIDATITDFKKNYNAEVVSFDCSASYLFGSLLLILSVLF